MASLEPADRARLADSPGVASLEPADRAGLADSPGVASLEPADRAGLADSPGVASLEPADRAGPADSSADREDNSSGAASSTADSRTVCRPPDPVRVRGWLGSRTSSR
jgi:antitoxin (DNA-binding transcriptional repressor) of toxin-antitoxin stability system